VWVLLWAVGETRACLPEELTVADLGSADG
jgi:hypothetical protein